LARCPFDDLPTFLTVAEFMVVARVKRTAAYAMLREGLVPRVKFGRAVRIPKTALLTSDVAALWLKAS
jgi:excisionase family DNA binding protein